MSSPRKRGSTFLDSRLKFAAKLAESVQTNLAALFGGRTGMTMLDFSS